MSKENPVKMLGHASVALLATPTKRLALMAGIAVACAVPALSWNYGCVGGPAPVFGPWGSQCPGFNSNPTTIYCGGDKYYAYCAGGPIALLDYECSPARAICAS